MLVPLKADEGAPVFPQRDLDIVEHNKIKTQEDPREGEVGRGEQISRTMLTVSSSVEIARDSPSLTVNERLARFEDAQEAYDQLRSAGVQKGDHNRLVDLAKLQLLVGHLGALSLFIKGLSVSECKEGLQGLYQDTHTHILNRKDRRNKTYVTGLLTEVILSAILNEAPSGGNDEELLAFPSLHHEDNGNQLDNLIPITTRQQWLSWDSTAISNTGALYRFEFKASSNMLDLPKGSYADHGVTLIALSDLPGIAGVKDCAQFLGTDVDTATRKQEAMDYFRKKTTFAPNRLL